MVLTSKIIEAVKKHPNIWLSSKRACNNEKNKVWSTLAEQLNIDEESLKKRWKNIKDQYRKELKKLILDPTADPNEVINWVYFKELGFLKQEMLKRPYRVEKGDDRINTDDNFKEESTEITFVEFSDNENDDLQISDDNSEATIPKRARMSLNEPLYGPEPVLGADSSEKLYEMCNKIVGKLQSYLKVHEDRLYLESNDSDLNFFRSMLPNVKKLNEYQKLQFQGKVIQSLLECLGQEDVEQSSAAVKIISKREIK